MCGCTGWVRARWVAGVRTQGWVGGGYPGGTGTYKDYAGIGLLGALAGYPLALARPGPEPVWPLRLSSHRILPVSSRVSGLYVSIMRDEASPRSHFRGRVRQKIPFLFSFREYLRGLD